MLKCFQPLSEVEKNSLLIKKKKRELKNRIFKLKSLEKNVKKRLKPLGINQKVV